MKKILIFGNSSMVGKRIYDSLQDKYYIKTVGRNGEADINFDIKNLHYNLETDEQFDVVINCIASFEKDDTVGAINNEIVNSLGAMLVGILAHKVKCKHVLYLSSIFTYDNPENGYYGSYGISKRHGQENTGLICEKLGMGYTTLLCAQLYDEYGKARQHQPLFYSIIDNAKEGKDITFYGKRDPQRNFVFVEDLVKVIEQVIDHQIFGIFPCVHPISNSLVQIAETAFRVFGKGGKVKFLPERQDIPTVYIPENQELYKLIDSPHFTELETGITLIRNQLLSKEI